MDRILSDVAGSPVFGAGRAPYLLLDRELVIRGVNDAYLTATGRAREQLVGAAIFEAFPDNPDDPGADGVRNLESSLRVVLGYGRRRPSTATIPRAGSGTSTSPPASSPPSST